MQLRLDKWTHKVVIKIMCSCLSGCYPQTVHTEYQCSGFTAIPDINIISCLNSFSHTSKRTKSRCLTYVNILNYNLYILNEASSKTKLTGFVYITFDQMSEY